MRTGPELAFRPVAIHAKDSIARGESVLLQPRVERSPRQLLPVLVPATVDVVDGEKGQVARSTAGAGGTTVSLHDLQNLRIPPAALVRRELPEARFALRRPGRWHPPAVDAGAGGLPRVVFRGDLAEATGAVKPVRRPWRAAAQTKAICPALGPAAYPPVLLDLGAGGAVVGPPVPQRLLTAVAESVLQTVLVSVFPGH